MHRDVDSDADPVPHLIFYVPDVKAVAQTVTTARWQDHHAAGCRRQERCLDRDGRQPGGQPLRDGPAGRRRKVAASPSYNSHRTDSVQ